MSRASNEDLQDHIGNCLLSPAVNITLDEPGQQYISATVCVYTAMEVLLQHNGSIHSFGVCSINAVEFFISIVITKEGAVYGSYPLSSTKVSQRGAKRAEPGNKNLK